MAEGDEVENRPTTEAQDKEEESDADPDAEAEEENEGGEVESSPAPSSGPVDVWTTPAIPPQDGATEQDLVVFQKGRDCLLLLLEARKLLDGLIKRKEQLDAEAWAERRRLEEVRDRFQR